jgi:UDP-glucose 4-epimerase
VTDLADVHLLALDRLEAGSVTWNLGNGAGHSVLEVVRTVERLMGRPVPHRLGERRAGDPAMLVAGAARAMEAGWRPRFAALEDIVRTALAWREAHPGGYRIR